MSKSIFPLKMGILSIVLYASAHLLEEGLFDFPAWVEKFRFTIPMILLFKHLSRNAELNKKHVFKGIGTAILLRILPMALFLAFDSFVLKVQ